MSALLMSSILAAPIQAAEARTVATPSPVLTDREKASLLGSYLAGRVAQNNRDIKNASRYFRKALEQDPTNQTLILQSMILDVSAGDWKNVEQRALAVLEKNKKQHIARLIMGISAFNREDYRAARKYFKDAGRSPISLLVAVLAEAWTYKAEGQSELALKRLDQLGELSWAKFYQNYHRALISDISGSRRQARKLYKSLFAQEARTLRLTLAYVRHLSSSKRNKSALNVLNQHLEVANLHPMAQDLGEKLEAGQRQERFIKDAREGLAEVFYGVGDALTSEGGIDIGTLYLQMALKLKPDFPMALLALAEVFEDSKRYDLSNQVYGRIGQDSPLWGSVVIRKAFNLNAEKRVEEAKLLLDHLLTVEAENIDAYEAQGNILRAHKRFKEAIPYFTKAISLLEETEKDDWKYFYARGVSYERLKDWSRAEKDLETALGLNPDEPLVLNYLGYSWVDKGMHLKRAMKLIRKAVSEKPNDGYFVDSLGWAHFRLGFFKEAVKELEKAVALRADDPIINDHLGDAYWKVGRRLEARYQWQQSLDLKAEPEEAVKIRKKLKHGLPAKDPKKLAVLGGNSGKISDAVSPIKTLVKKPGNKPANKPQNKPQNKNVSPGQGKNNTQRPDNKAAGGENDEKKAGKKRKPQSQTDVQNSSAQSNEAEGVIYYVQRGDTLWKLSKKFYGNGRRYLNILKANPALGRRGLLVPGMKIRIPKF